MYAECMDSFANPYRLVVMILKFPFRFTRNFDTRVLRFDENRPGDRLSGFAKLRGKTLVPAMPQG